MRKADIFMHGVHAGVLQEIEPRSGYRFIYDEGYKGPAVSLTLPVREAPYAFDEFPAFLEGLLPEGYHLEALLRAKKIDRQDLFSQLVAVGADMVGALTVWEAE